MRKSNGNFVGNCLLFFSNDSVDFLEVKKMKSCLYASLPPSPSSGLCAALPSSRGLCASLPSSRGLCAALPSASRGFLR